MPDTSSWASNANDAVRISLRHPKTSARKDEIFHPAFTYPIFGEEEVVFGYKDLKIKLDFAADTLDPTATITWSEQYQTVGDTKAEDVQAKLAPFLASPERVYAGPEKEVVRPVVQVGAAGAAAEVEGQTPFVPPGERVHSYETGGRTYGVWSANLADPATMRLIRNMQIFVLFYIEGGTYISLDDPAWSIERWQMYFIYEIIQLSTSTDASYSFVGYSTTYRLYYLDRSPSSASSSSSPTREDSLALDYTSPSPAPHSAHLPSRLRISQFLILPPHQSAGHGTQLYTTMMRLFTRDPTIHEITIEDPNESFDNLRDYSDLASLRATPAFTALALNTSIQLPATKSTPLPTSSLLPTAQVTAARKDSKLAPRQFARLVEMQLLSRIPVRHRAAARITRKDRASDPQDRAYYFWRLLVKQRLYQHNVDTLAQLEIEERVEKLEETLVGVEADYLRILEEVERRAARAGMLERNGVVNGGQGDRERDGNGTSSVAGAGATGAGATGAGAGAGAKRIGKRKIVDEDDDEEDEDEDGNGLAGGASPAGSKRARVDDE